MKVTAPDGTRWRVGRQWWPERKPDVADAMAADVPSGSGAGNGLDLGDAEGILAVLVLIAVALLVVLFFTTVVIPVVVFTIELIVLIVLFFAGLAGRLLFRKPWTVRTRTDGRTMHRWQIVGFRNSGEFRDEVAAALSGGRVLPVRRPRR